MKKPLVFFCFFLFFYQFSPHFYQFSHKNSIFSKILGYFTNPEDRFCSRFYKCYFIFEFLRDSLSDQISQRKALQNFFTEEELWYLLSSLIYGLSFLQQMKISHGDVNPSTILVNEEGAYKVMNTALFANGANSFVKVLTDNRRKNLYVAPILMKVMKIWSFLRKMMVF